jgi:ketopantoate reductase
LRIVTETGELATPVRAVGTIAELGDVDLVIVAVKLWDTERVAAELPRVIERGAAVVSFQNGVHNVGMVIDDTKSTKCADDSKASLHRALRELQALLK